MTFPRRVYTTRRVTQVPQSRQIVKYMEYWKFENLIRESALYFRRIDHFNDTFEGKIPLAVWNLSAPEIQKWYG